MSKTTITIELINLSETPDWQHTSKARDQARKNTEWKALISNYRAAKEFDRAFIQDLSALKVRDVIEFGCNRKISGNYSNKYKTYAFVMNLPAGHLLIACYPTPKKAIFGNRADEIIAARTYLSELLEDFDGMSVDERTPEESAKAAAARSALEAMQRE